MKMAQDWRLVAPLVMGEALAASSGYYAFAQTVPIVPDATLGAESSIVTSTADHVDAINGGATRGTNLFHSFEQFSVLTGRTAYFNNSANIQNIITRVTGVSVSNIDGLISAKGTANLFLINPNGIIFGSNAQLGIGGSFLASTASSLNFADGTQFSATALQTTPLLTVSVPIGLQFGSLQSSTADLQNQGALAVQGSNLSVQTGKTLALVGRDVTISGSNNSLTTGLTAGGIPIAIVDGNPVPTTPGGRIELGSVTSGSVSLTPTRLGFTLGYGESQNFGNIQLSGGTNVNTSGTGGGEIQIQARNLRLSEGSRIASFTLGALPGGNITVNASESVKLTGTGTFIQDVQLFGTGILSPSDLRNGFFSANFGTGGAGYIVINTRKFIARNGAFVTTSTFGQGAGGDLTVVATDSVELGASALGTGTGRENAGRAGNLTIITGKLIAKENGLASTSSLGEGQAGTLTVRASDSVELIGGNPIEIQGNSLGSIFINTGLISGSRDAGDAGAVQVTTGRLILRDGGQVNANTVGQGRGGDVNVTAADSVVLMGTSPNGQTPSSLIAFSAPGSTGPGGFVTITTPNLIVDEAVISTSTFGEGNGGVVTINASESVELIGSGKFDLLRQLLDRTFNPNSLRNGLFTVSFGAGDAGDLTINTRRLTVQDGAAALTSSFMGGKGGELSVTALESVELVNSGLLTGTTATEAAGNLTINTGELVVRDGAVIGTSTLSQGRAGNIEIMADVVELSGTTPPENPVLTGIYASTVGGTGAAGEINIDTRRLIVQDGSQILTNSGALFDGNLDSVGGEGGEVIVNATEFVELTGIPGVSPQLQTILGTITFSPFQAGNLSITTGELIVRDGAEVNVSSQGSGIAGDLEVKARSIRLDNEGNITSETFSGQGGEVALQAQDLLLLRDNSNISTRAGTEETGGTGGNITINTNNLVAQENSDIDADAFGGSGGEVTINAQGVFGTEGREERNELTNDITASSNLGPQFSGIVEINTPEVDPSQGLVALPAEIVDASELIAQGCNATEEDTESKFTITGRGGLPPNPSETLSSDAVWEDSRLPSVNIKDNADTVTTTQPSNPEQVALLPATGWVFNKKGEVTLIAQAPNVTPDNLRSNPTTCRVR